MTQEVYLGLGSNLGDREKNISDALSLLSERLGSDCRRLSGICETKAEGFDGNDFLNCAACFRTSAGPEELLDICKDVERALGRTDPPEHDAEGKRIYHNRTIDIDILLYGKEMIDTERLVIPHPRMFEREFVMKPLREIYKGKI